MSTKNICPKCKKEISNQATECPYCGIVLKKYNNLKLNKSFYSASYQDLSIAEKLKEEFKNYHALSMLEKTKLIAKAKKYNFLDLASYYIRQNKDNKLDKDIVFALSKLNLETQKRYSFFSKPVLLALSILVAIIISFFII